MGLGVLLSVLVTTLLLVLAYAWGWEQASWVAGIFSASSGFLTIARDLIGRGVARASQAERDLSAVVRRMVKAVGSVDQVADLVNVEPKVVREWFETSPTAKLPSAEQLRVLWTATPQRERATLPSRDMLTVLRRRAGKARSRRSQLGHRPVDGPLRHRLLGLLTGTAAWSPRRRAATLGSAVVLLAVGVGSVVLWFGHAPHGSTGHASVRATGTGSSAPTHSARVTRAPHGTFAYAGPYGDGASRKQTQSLFEGDPVHIECQEPEGRPIVDDSLPARSTVWDRLTDGSWLSDLYTDLPGALQGKPSPGIPTCPRPPSPQPS